VGPCAEEGDRDAADYFCAGDFFASQVFEITLADSLSGAAVGGEDGKLANLARPFPDRCERPDAPGGGRRFAFAARWQHRLARWADVHGRKNAGAIC